MTHKYHFGYSKKFSEKWQEIFKGQSWDNPFDKLQDAYNACSETGPGKIIFVCDPEVWERTFGDIDEEE